MGTKILVLGGRFGGLTAAYSLRRLAGDRAEVHLIDKERVTYFRPAIPHVSIGVKQPEELGIDLSKALPRKGIHFRQAEVVRIRPDDRKVEWKDPEGTTSTEGYDYLIISMGAHLAKELVRGAEENADALCEISDMLRLRQKLEVFQGGQVTIGSGTYDQGHRPAPKFPERFVPRGDSACEGPIFEYSLMLPGYLKRHGLMAKTKITVYAPGTYLGDLSEGTRKVVRGMYGTMGIDLVENFRLAEVRPDAVVSEDGRTLPSNLSVYKPPYTGLSVLKALSGHLADDAGFVPTDLNMVSLTHDTIYAIGDANAGIVVKLGYAAVRSAEIAAQHLARRLGVEVKVDAFQPSVFCVADNPLEGYAIAVADDTFYGGTHSEAKPAPVNHVKKELFAKYYLWTKGDMVLEKYLASW